ncbi:hypothetical protein THIOM_000613 [Candidatus Thiomargarita nelsonii]|uniref:Uncharacterized protein n=1 Tax=Candidatus Thiomargarita nelsonii TaxID=1003181 RepID=A0A176S5Y8_9GAMM|nr:hypothetical protein THIOM_000613 [Candidatus Thiomargarita nelsonii]
MFMGLNNSQESKIYLGRKLLYYSPASYGGIAVLLPKYIFICHWFLGFFLFLGGGQPAPTGPWFCARDCDLYFSFPRGASLP